MDIVKDVAVYLRKSRGEEDTDLDKHRNILKEYALKNNWRYVEYVEIASSETIEYRPKFKQLLKDVQNEMFDAVLVVEFDRLGRGDLEDQALVKRIFRDSSTLIVTPDKIYNLSDDSDDLMVDVKGLLARQEYKAIKKRLSRGKKIGAKLGKWTNGTPPFPYKYDIISRQLVVDEENKIIYDEMKSLFFQGKPFYEICWNLNNKGIASPRGGVWHENTIRRILLDETHLGRIVSNKSEGSAHKKKKTKTFKQLPREEWTIVENCHAAVKTLEEHDKITSVLVSRRIVPKKTKAGTYILSGLVFCGKCNKSMQFQTKSNGNIVVKKCQHSDPYGNMCGNRGLPAKIILDFLSKELERRKDELLKINEGLDREKEVSMMEAIRTEKEKQIAKASDSISRARSLYIDEEITKEEYTEEKNKREKIINTLEKDIHDLTLYIENNKKISQENKLQLIIDVQLLLPSKEASTKEKNTLLKQVLEGLSYIRDHNDNIDIRSHFI